MLTHIYAYIHIYKHKHRSIDLSIFIFMCVLGLTRYFCVFTDGYASRRDAKAEGGADARAAGRGEAALRRH